MKKWLVTVFLLGGFVNSSSLERTLASVRFEAQKTAEIDQNLRAVISGCLGKNNIQAVKIDNCFVEIVQACIGSRRKVPLTELEEIVLSQYLLFLLYKESGE